MSFEGYDQLLCSQGHLSIADCYDSVELYSKNELCRCGEVFVFRHIVDQTNGYDETNPDNCDMKFEEITPEEVEVCNLGHEHIIKEATYRIPERG